jgi:hypothetical protein
MRKEIWSPAIRGAVFMFFVGFFVIDITQGATKGKTMLDLLFGCLWFGAFIKAALDR